MTWQGCSRSELSAGVLLCCADADLASEKLPSSKSRWSCYRGGEFLSCWAKQQRMCVALTSWDKESTRSLGISTVNWKVSALNTPAPLRLTASDSTITLAVVVTHPREGLTASKGLS